MLTRHTAGKSKVSQQRGLHRSRARVVVVCAAANAPQITAAKADVEALIRNTHSNPILIRLGWHDAGTHNKNISEWPKSGGATGSIRLSPEIGHGANAGLQGALDLIEPIKQKHPAVSYADLYQMASALGVELAGGPKLEMRYGRVDVNDPAECAPEGNLPGERVKNEINFMLLALQGFRAPFSSVHATYDAAAGSSSVSRAAEQV
eukprot:GHRR01030046.1.p1 GENE.GHRR01030046.1~~GHRR01030046.1.p1  ORF type:complete len:206 (+),score=42.37 GHRR01030046.1:131-748(+)